MEMLRIEAVMIIVKRFFYKLNFSIIFYRGYTNFLFTNNLCDISFSLFFFKFGYLRSSSLGTLEYLIFSFERCSKY